MKHKVFPRYQETQDTNDGHKAASNVQNSETRPTDTRGERSSSVQCHGAATQRTAWS
jgi:hypothetical protein